MVFGSFSQPKTNKQPMKRAACFNTFLLLRRLFIFAFNEPKVSETEPYRKPENIFFDGIIVVSAFHILQPHIYKADLPRRHAAWAHRQSKAERSAVLGHAVLN